MVTNFLLSCAFPECARARPDGRPECKRLRSSDSGDVWIKIKIKIPLTDSFTFKWSRVRFLYFLVKPACLITLSLRSRPKPQTAAWNKLTYSYTLWIETHTIELTSLRFGTQPAFTPTNPLACIGLNHWDCRRGRRNLHSLENSILTHEIITST